MYRWRVPQISSVCDGIIAFLAPRTMWHTVRSSASSSLGHRPGSPGGAHRGPASATTLACLPGQPARWPLSGSVTIMNDTNDRDHAVRDRLPDVRPSRPVGGYTAVHLPRPADRPLSRREPEPEDPAWWETDQPARLPDALRWRPGSVVSARLPQTSRSALDGDRTLSGGVPEQRWPTDDLDDLLGESRYRGIDPLPTWTDSDLDRERASWQDERNAVRGGRRPKRGKRDRTGRQNRGGRSGPDR